jgi:type IV pilus biogenesis protein CpaD/CtpE
MKVRVLPVVLSFCVLGLAACASHEQTAAYVEPAAVGGQAQVDRIEVDRAYISKVERVALRRGIDVHWVNAPNRRIARE